MLRADVLFEEIVIDGRVVMRGNGTAAIVYNNLVRANELPDWDAYLGYMTESLSVGALEGRPIEFRVLGQAVAAGVVGAMGERVDVMAKLDGLWKAFGDVPVNAADEIEMPFLDFDVGANREAVWAWFERQDPRFSVGDRMSANSAGPAP